MELNSKIQQLADSQAFVVAIVSANGPEFKDYLSATTLDEHSLKPKQKEAILTEIAYNSALTRYRAAPGFPRSHGEMGEPIWPNGFVGSVTHKNGIAIVAIAGQTKYQSLGIDLEYLNPQRERNIQFRVLSVAEQKLLERSKTFQADLLQLFSAKESIYKAIYPLTHHFFGFKDVECISPIGNSLTFVLKRKLGQDFEEGNKIQVNCITGNEYLFTAVTISMK